MQTKSEQLSTKISIFDIDDLSFYRYYGLGLRHVELELGIKEAASGNTKGDAVSLACYGCNPEEDFSPEFNLCVPFQEKVEDFILKSYQEWHQPHSHYNDAAFLLMIRGADAQFPYDFRFYPLGKCGTKEFTADQVMALIKTDSYVNDDINHAVSNSLMSLKQVTRQLKLQKARELSARLDNNPELQKLCNTLIEHYQANVFLEKPFFLIIAKLVEQSKAYFRELPKLMQDQEEFLVLKNWMQEINFSQKKGENPVKVLYQPDNFDLMDAQTLSKRLIHFIKNQNLAKVELCLTYLSKTSFNPEKDSTIQTPLQAAAGGRSVDILKAVYEFDPSQYETVVENKILATPIYTAAYYDHLANLKYLLSKRKLIPRDLSIFNAYRNTEVQHILLRVTASCSKDSYEIMQLLIKAQQQNFDPQLISYGFESKDKNFDSNPLSIASRFWGTDKEGNDKKFEFFLPHANAWAKYLAILSATFELYYCYGHGPRKELIYAEELINLLFGYRNKILASLSQEECVQIRSFAAERNETVLVDLEKILLDDSIEF